MVIRTDVQPTVRMEKTINIRMIALCHLRALGSPRHILDILSPNSTINKIIIYLTGTRFVVMVSVGKNRLACQGERGNNRLARETKAAFFWVSL
jgi:hypothetical protein